MSVITQATTEFEQRRLVEHLARYSYLFGDERSFQDGLASALSEGEFTFEKEYVAGPKDRFDFLVQGGIVIEAKVKGSFSTALNQISRYAARPDVTGVVLVTTRHWGRQDQALTRLHGKPVSILKVKGAAF